MSEKDIKTKPKSTTKSVQNAPKSVSRSPAETVKDIKAVAKDTIVKNAIDNLKNKCCQEKCHQLTFL